jgi:hypothetical protein
MMTAHPCKSGAYEPGLNPQRRKRLISPAKSRRVYETGGEPILPGQRGRAPPPQSKTRNQLTQNNLTDQPLG